MKFVHLLTKDSFHFLKILEKIQNNIKCYKEIK